jgi:NADP-dependent aldehyde dehydrogenase
MQYNITGSNFTGFSSSAKGSDFFQAFAPAENHFLEGNFHNALPVEMERALALAESAFALYQKVSAAKRAEFLEAIAEEIMTLGDALIERCVAESALPVARITGERGRTCGQLKMFAQLLRDGWYVDARIDTAQPDRKPLPKSDIRRMLIPIGPVAVFGASNFPLAFSTAGGDTASALAAGCPVIVKAHSSHPGTNEMVAFAIIKAAQKTGMPDGVFSSLYLSHTDAVKLVEHPIIEAVGFTGSRNVGIILFHAAVNRPDSIPVYAEMSSVNPLILLEGALADKEKIAKDLAASITLGAGQFCTNPGLVLMVDGEVAQAFLEGFASQLKNMLPATMLNRNICKAFVAGVESLQKNSEVKLLAESAVEATEERYQARPVVHTIKGVDFLKDKKFSEEVFGPASLFVLCENTKELIRVLASLEGQLTATIHATNEDEKQAGDILNVIAQKAGRLIYGGYPTGVEVCHSMQHGGPFPATTDVRSTSVGTAAVYRFLRPVAFQDFPGNLLPETLRNDNPLGILRLLDGVWTKEKC